MSDALNNAIKELRALEGGKIERVFARTSPRGAYAVLVIERAGEIWELSLPPDGEEIQTVVKQLR